MKRFCWVLMIVVLVTSVADAATGRTLQVGVKDAPLRATPAPFGQILKTLHVGDSVDVKEERGAWMRIRSASGEGWIHGSMLNGKSSALRAGAGNLSATASNDEITLAGKGFNSRVESEYRKQNQKLDYATIDRMETMVVPQEKMSRFIQEGGLIPEGGRDAR